MTESLTETDMSDDVKMPSLEAALLTALTPSLQPTGEHKALPDGYCPDCCGAPCIRTWLGQLPVEQGDAQKRRDARRVKRVRG